jgi:hypothetical protein
MLSRWLILLLTVVSGQPASANEPLRVLFLGDNGHHRPAERFRQLAPVFAQRGVELTYLDTPDALRPAVLAKYAGLLIYANIDSLAKEQETALLDYVNAGRGLIAVHCASFCFRNSAKYVELVGGQFEKHGTGIFTTTVTAPQHPLVRGYGGFGSWDETYQHTKHNPKDRVVLEQRGTEPYTWVRTQGQGRVFYTAWGHDERTWSHLGFQNLLERGVRWATGHDVSQVPAYADVPAMTQVPADAPKPTYSPADVPFYPANPTWGTLGENLKQMPNPLKPADALRHYVHPQGFALQLFASEELLGGKPIAINWDERGRLWVALTVDYPNELRPTGQGRDRIVIATDTNGDGVADKVTVFADKLSIPTSFTFANGGIVVMQAPDTLFLRDTNGDDVADERRVLFTGWSTRDTHAGPSNLVYGCDHWIYGMVGYSGFDGTVGGVKHSFRTGFFRFRADGSALEFLRNTSNNSWGVGFSEDGHLFGSTANGNPSVYLPIANRYYEAVRGWSASVLGTIAMSDTYVPITEKVRQVDFHGRFTAGAGHALYTARTYPRDYWNRTAFVAEPTGHLVATFRVQPHGTDFISRNTFNLVASDDEWAAPIMAEVGPDGNVWIVDWYNYIVQHNPTPKGFKTGAGNAYETPLRDKKHGRIYRLVYDTAPIKPQPPMTTAEQLVTALGHDNLFWRRHAQRLLIERQPADVVPALAQLLEDRRVDELGLNVAAQHALWTLDGLKAITPAQLTLASQHPAPAVRRVAAQLASRVSNGSTVVLPLLRDADAQVRLAAALTCADLPASAELGPALAQALARVENAHDKWLPEALTAAGARQVESFLPALATVGKLPMPALSAVRIVAGHAARSGNWPWGQWLVQLGAGDAHTLAAVLEGSAKNWPTGQKLTLSPAEEQALAELLPKLSAASRANLVRWGVAGGSPVFAKYASAAAQELWATVSDERSPASQRAAAARQAFELAPDDSALVGKVLDLLSPRLDPALATQLLDALSANTSATTGAALTQRYASWSPSVQSASRRLLLSRGEWTKALVAALEAGTVPLADLSADQQQALAAHPDKALANRAKKLLTRSGGLPNPDRQKVIDELEPLTKQVGDAPKGQAVFTKHCATCHRHGELGLNVGPDLSGMAAHPKHELLIHILDPHRSVEGNYRVYTVATKDGKVFTGLLASETKTTLEIVDAQAKKHVVQRDDVEEFTGSNKSLMPEGFEKQIPPTELSDLLTFLTQRGKYLPLSLAKVATAISTKGLFTAVDNPVERLVFDDWKPKTFQGVPFHLVDPQGDRVPNLVLLQGPKDSLTGQLPKSVRVPYSGPAKAIHLLSGVGGWCHPYHSEKQATLIVRLHYADKTSADFPLLNGVHFADYIRRVDVPGSQFAFDLKGRQVRYLRIKPDRVGELVAIELVKGPDLSAPAVLAVTVETE